MTAEKATAQEATRKVAFAKVLAIQIIAYVVLVALALVPGMMYGDAAKPAAVPFTIIASLAMVVLLVVFSPFRDGVAGHVIAAIAGLLSAICATTVMLGNVIFPAGLDGGKSFSMEEAWIAGVGGLLILSTVAASLRMLFTGMSQSAGLAAVAQLLHGWDTIVMMFAMAKYINLTVPDDLKASGQMLFNVIALGVARAVGSWISGQLVGLTDLRMPFYFSAAICLISVVIFGAIILKNRDLRSAGREE